jgi:hypothetical protein
MERSTNASTITAKAETSPDSLPSKAAIPDLGSGGHSYDLFREPANLGLLDIARFAFLLGFALEEEFEVIVRCAGSVYCPELTQAYALTVVAGIVGLRLLLIAGHQRHEERVEG